MLEIEGKYNIAKVYTNILEEGAASQIETLCNQEFVKENKIRIMPDVHAGAGCNRQSI
jgi:tRNA-splicing ligase RtcB (3'-phosphate/5'-hydroxy nucleic acid ligase)